MAKQKSAIVFIDGNNLYHNLRASRIKPSSISLQKLSNLVCEHFGCIHKKTIYYNSIPDIRDSEETYYQHMKFLDKIRSIPKFEVKTRKLQKNITKEVMHSKLAKISQLSLCKLCKPIVETNCKECIGDFKVKEKGIDVMMAVDAINLSVIKKQCDYCILITGDADFIPAMDLIKKAGKMPVSAALYKGYSYELREKHGWFILDRKLVLDNCSK